MCGPELGPHLTRREGLWPSWSRDTNLKIPPAVQKNCLCTQPSFCVLSPETGAHFYPWTEVHRGNWLKYLTPPCAVGTAKEGLVSFTAWIR